MTDVEAAEHKFLRNCRKCFSVTSLYDHKEWQLLQRRSKMVCITHIPQLERDYPLKSNKFSSPTLLQLS
jgi:hypothetical protein